MKKSNITCTKRNEEDYKKKWSNSIYGSASFFKLYKKKNKNFYFTIEKKFNYFSANNHKFLGKISKIDGSKLNIQMIHHTFEDYFKLIKNAKINSIEEVTELTVNNNLKRNSKSLYYSLKGLPLHLYFLNLEIFK